MATINVTAIKASLKSAAGQYKSLYQASSNCISATVNIRMLTVDIITNSKIRLYVVPGSFSEGVTPPDDAFLIQPKDLILGPDGVTVGVFEDTAIVLNPQEQVIVYSDNGNVVSRIHGFNRTAV